METINIEDQCLLYFFYNKKEKVYIGETSKGYGRFYQHKDKKFDKHNVKYISGKKLNFINNEYFRKYYELRLINRFKPKYNKETTTAPTLNLFLLKMFLWFENPNPLWINPLTRYCEFMRPMNSNGDYWLENTHEKKTRWSINKYTRVWETLDLSKKLYINNQNAFKFLINEEMKPALKVGRLRKIFTPRKERLHN